MRLEYLLCAVALVVSFAVSFVLTRFGIPFLKRKRMGQTILEIGPSWHKEKEGTPTMGGIFFGAGSLLVFLACALPLILLSPTVDLTALFVLLFVLGHGAIGLMDDYVKFIKHQNKGLTATQKLVLQFAVTAAFLFSLSQSGHTGTALELPFAGGLSLELGVFYYLFVLVFVVGVINAVNLTDGLDGLAGSCVSVVLVLFAALSVVSLVLGRAGDFGARAVFAFSLLGGVVAFLCFNRYPAKIFMGDTGSLLLGSAICALALWFDLPLILLFCGILFLFEAVSVMLQVLYFKLTHGKRLFKMAPFHHHLEKCGMGEVAIVAVFTAVTLLGCVVAIFAFPL